MRPTLISLQPSPQSPQVYRLRRVKDRLHPPAQKVKADSSTESSETDDDEPVKQGVTPTPKLASLPAVSAARLKAQSSLPTSQSIKAKSSSESSESDSEEESVKQDKKPAKAAKVVKASPTKPTRGLSKAATPAQANASAVKVQLHSQILVSETESDSSDSEEKQKTPSAVTSQRTAASPMTPVVASKAGTPSKTEQPSEETSEEESSDSDEEPATKTPATVSSTPQPKTLSLGIKQIPVVAAKTPLKSSQPADKSSEEESSDSDEEPSVKKPATVLPLSQQKTPLGRAKQAPVLAKIQSPVKTARQADESSEEESDSDEESAAKKPTAVQSSQPKTPSGEAKQTTLKATLKTPLKIAQSVSESSEEESDSDEETVAKKSATALQSTQQKSPGGGPKQTAVLAKSKISQPNRESSSEESDSDEEAAAKTSSSVQVKMSTPSSALTVKRPLSIQVPDSDADSESSESSDTEHKQRSKSTAPVKVTEGTPTVVGKLVTKPAAADASDSSDSDDEEKAQPKPSAVSSGVKGKQTVSTSLKPDDRSEESESESDKEPVKLAEVKTLEKQKAKRSASQPKTTAQPVRPAAIFSKGKSLVTSKVTTVPQALAESSESTESSDNEDLSPAQVTRTSVMVAPPAAKSTAQPAAVAKHKAGGPTKNQSQGQSWQ
ncbi:unnamed protein product [Staurois parvus]|uniref:Uncharacterized protein n=1 Tax=Staurois parvus TaxID=386267 RepID=A0ABN9GPR6_9NEOB|nr:unnamed protein product [Staurois parvus]